MLFDELVRSYDRGRNERNAFHDLMRFRVREVLFIGSLFDSFVMEADGVFIEQSYGEYFKLNLGAVPRISIAHDGTMALKLAGERAFDVIIVMASTDFVPSVAIARELGKALPGIPLLLLVTNNAVLASMERANLDLSSIDRVFVWNGYSKLFVGMLKFVEDLLNSENDAATGLVRVILLIEDSARYYSRYLPLLYRVIMRQTQALIEEERGDEIYKLLRSRARPKVLLLDEPAMGVAPLIVYDLFSSLRALRDQNGLSIFLVEQHVRAGLQIADYGYVLENGRIVLHPAKKERERNDDVREFYLGLSLSQERRSFRDVKHYKRRKRWLG